MPVPQEKAFSFFEDPENLFEITPDWLDFKMVDMNKRTKIFEGVELHCTIKWLGLKFNWGSRILEYKPPEHFTDIQIKGPYHYWSHLHTFEEFPQGTLMVDEVTYRMPFGFIGKALHNFVVKKQLKDIFCYRAVRISEWVQGERKRKLIRKIDSKGGL